MITLELKNITDEVQHDGKTYLLFEKPRIEKLLEDLFAADRRDSQHAAEVEQIKKTVLAIMTVMGLIDPATGKLRQSLENGEESYIKYIGKSLASLATQMAFSGSKVKEKFAFIEEIMPIVKKYAGN